MQATKVFGVLVLVLVLAGQPSFLRAQDTYVDTSTTVPVLPDASVVTGAYSDGTYADGTSTLTGTTTVDPYADLSTTSSGSTYTQPVAQPQGPRPMGGHFRGFLLGASSGYNLVRVALGGGPNGGQGMLDLGGQRFGLANLQLQSSTETTGDSTGPVVVAQFQAALVTASSAGATYAETSAEVGTIQGVIVRHPRNQAFAPPPQPMAILGVEASPQQLPPPPPGELVLQATVSGSSFSGTILALQQAGPGGRRGRRGQGGRELRGPMGMDGQR